MNDAVLSFGQSGSSNAKIINEGTITAKDAGLIALVAPNVENNGFIGARLGKVQLAGADTFTLDFYGDGLLSVAVDSNTVATSVANTGIIRARAGSIALTAVQAAHVISSTINLSGILDVGASRVDANGTVIFGDGVGGDVTATGGDIALSSDARIQASGPNGGGSVHIGGEFQGKGSLPWAQTVSVAPGARIAANATKQGDGGDVVLWSKDQTLFGGDIHARGGKEGGNGGLVETSSKNILGVSGFVDASAANGIAGNWLLDPTNISITQGGGTDVTAGGCGAGPYACTDVSVSANSIQTALNANNVTIQATGDITLNSSTIAKNSASNQQLTLKAEGSILTNGTNSITAAGAGKLNVILWADAEAAPNNIGSITLIDTTINTNGGDVVMGGGKDDGTDIISATDGTTVLYNAAAADGRPDGYAWGEATNDDGILLYNSSVNAGAGSIIMRGHGRNAATGNQNGVFILGASFVKSDSGSILLDGKGGNAGSTNTGINISDAGTIIRSTTGNITLNGGGGDSTGDFNYGVLLQGGATVDSDGTGGSAAPITLLGKGGTAGASNNNYGVAIFNSTISARDGDMTLTGVAASGATVNNGFRLNNSTLSANGDANITISGTKGDSAAGDFDIGGGTINIGGASATGTITFIGNDINTFSNTTAQTQNNIIFKPRTPGTSVGISGGACGGTCTLQLTDAVLTQLNPDVDANGTGSLIIGDNAAATGTVDINGWDISGKTYDVEVYAGLVDFTGSGVIWNRDNSLLFNSRTNDITIDQNFTRNAGVAGNGTLTFKASGSLISSGARSITAAGGATSGALNTIFWSDAEAAPNSNGYIHITNTTINTNGGDVIMAGGLDNGANGGAAADGRPDNLAFGNTTGHEGVYLDDVTLTTGAGNIIMNGSAWDNAATSTLNGVYIDSGTAITTTSGNITMLGFGGDGTDNNYGVYLYPFSSIMTADGDVSITGTGGNGSTDHNIGIFVSGDITSTGTGAGAGNITLNGTGSGASWQGEGVRIEAGGGWTSNISAVDGDISITGTGQSNGSVSQYGIFIRQGATISSSGTGASAGNITINGTGGAALRDNVGVLVDDTGTAITTVDGDISIIGTARGTTTDNYGIKIESGSDVISTGTGASAGLITLNGTGGNGTSNNYGIFVKDSGTLISSSMAAISFTGLGRGTGDNNEGIEIGNSADVVSTATGATAGSITFDGTASATATGQMNIGTMIRNPGTLVTAVDGDISVIGHGNNSAGIKGSGIWIHNDAHVETTGTGANAGDITLAGFGLNGDEQHGIVFQAHGRVYTAKGNINVTGSAVGTNNAAGILFVNGGEVDSLAGNISLTGTKVGGSSDIVLLPYTDTNLIGSNTMTGNITFNADSLDFQAQDIRTQNNILFVPRTNNTDIGISGGGGGLQITDGILATLAPDVDANGTGSLIIGNSAAGTGTVDINGWNISGSRYDVEVYGGTVDFTGTMRWNQDNSLFFYSRTGNINIDQTFSRDAGVAGDGTLTLKAAGNITSSGTRTVTAATAGATGKLNTILWADADNNGSGLINLTNVTFVTNNGDFVAAGGLDDGANILAADGATILYDGTAADGRPDNYATAQNAANNDGVTIDNTDITTGTGNIIVRGHGFDEVVGATDYKIGTLVFDDSDLLTTSGNIVLDGKGGNGNSYGRGLGIYDTTTTVTTNSGAISIIGRGASAGADVLNGLIIFDGATIQSTGTGAGLGAINLQGVGGNGTGNSHFGTAIIDSNIITDNADLNIIGRGGNGVDSNHGAQLNNATISTVDADITITGTAGNGRDDNVGVVIANTSTLTSTGTTAAAGKINITGHSGTGRDFNRGVFLRDAGTIISSGYGDISLTGDVAAVTGTGNIGVIAFSGSQITSTGTTNTAANITLLGTAGTGGTQYNYGVQVTTANARIDTVDGDILITGIGKGTTNDNYGINLEGSADIVSTGTGVGAGTITLDGTGGNGTLSNYGILTKDAGTTITSVDGAVALTGQGGLTATSSNNYGIWTAAPITTTGTGSISLNGTGGGGTNYADGVYMNTALSTVDGDITIIGQGGTAIGRVEVGAYIEGTAISSGAGNITINGSGGDDATDSNWGAYFTGAGTHVEVKNGNLQITGSGGDGSADRNYGIMMDTNASLASVGTGALAGNITLNGTGGAGTLKNHGVYLTGNSTVTTVDGDILFTGHGTGTGNNNVGVSVESSSVTSTGTGASAGTIGLVGTGGSGNSINFGVSLDSSTVSTADGNLSINGTGGNGTINSINAGIIIAGWGSDNTVTSTGSGTITLTASHASASDPDLYLENAGAANIVGGAGTSSAITINADTITTFAANHTFRTSGNITVKPRTLGQNINLAGVAAGGLDLTTQILDSLVAGSITIGQATGTGTINLGAYAWDDPVRFMASATGSIAVTGAQTAVAASNADLRFSGPTTLNNTINISNATTGTRSLVFNNAVTLGANSTLNTGAGNITFDSTLDGAHTLGITTTGDLTFTGNVGLLTPLGDVTIANVHDLTADILYANNFTVTGGTGNVAFSNNSLHAAADVNISTSGNITGTYYGINGLLHSTAGNVNATVNFDTLDITGLGATLLAGRVGAAGVADQTMANRISIGGVLYPTLIADPAYTFASYIIGDTPVTPPPAGGGGGSGGGTLPGNPGLPGTPGGGGNGGSGSGGGNGGGSAGGGSGSISDYYALFNDFEAAQRLQVMDVTRGTLLFEAVQFDPTFGSVVMAPAPEIVTSPASDPDEKKELPALSSESGIEQENTIVFKRPLYRMSRNIHYHGLSTINAQTSENK